MSDHDSLGDKPLGGDGLGATPPAPGSREGSPTAGETASASSGQPPSGRRVPVRQLGRRAAEGQSVAARDALVEAGTDPVAHVAVFSSEPADPDGQRRAERTASALFVLSALGTIGFCSVWFFTNVSGNNLRHLQLVDYALGISMAAIFIGLGAGFIVWAKHLMPHVKFVQSREQFYSEPEDELAAERVVLDGVAATGIARRSLLKRTLGLAMGLLPLPALFALRDVGPRPGTTLRQTAWRAGDRLVDMDSGRPIKLGDLPIGGFITVMPEGHTDPLANPLTPTVLIRLAPGQNHPLPGRSRWTAHNHIAYSKICTHAGCPVGLYEQQTHVMLCPCHQSTFLVTEGAKVIFGPAARNLPQLPIYVDSKGFFRARSAYLEPCGPSFWERGYVPTTGEVARKAVSS
ncbi:MAG: cytochrome bc1 complex Rieske iron-sulfur subunit [Mycobacteriales bacterium]